MESKVSEKKIRDWAMCLGFLLPDGSSPPLNYFALLTATPHRRLLWEVIMDSVQSKKKIQAMKKQMFVLKIKEISHRTDNLNDKNEFWERQESLSLQAREKRDMVSQLERSIMAQASDSFFEICKVAELEKQCDECKDRVLVLKLLFQRQKALFVELNEMLLEIAGISNPLNFSEGKSFLNVTEGKSLREEYSYCGVMGHATVELCGSEMTDQCPWSKVIKLKQIILEQFYNALKLNVKEMSHLSEVQQRIENTLHTSISHLRQRITEKSLEFIVNEMEGRLLCEEIEKLLQRAAHFVKGSNGGSFNETTSFILTDDFSPEKTETLVKLRHYVQVKGLKTHQDFMRCEVKKLHDENTKELSSRTEENEFQERVNSLKSVANEIYMLTADKEALGREFVKHRKKLKASLSKISEGVNDAECGEMLAESVMKLKIGWKRQVDLFMDIPLDAFKTTDATPRKTAFQRDSSHGCLYRYGGEFKHFFSRALIPPGANEDTILGYVEKRKRCFDMLRKFAEEKKKLSEAQLKLHRKLASIKYDSRPCGSSFKDSDDILSNILFKAEGMTRNIDFIDKILKNWVEQPYRQMLKETATGNGQTLKEFEDRFRKITNE